MKNGATKEGTAAYLAERVIAPLKQRIFDGLAVPALGMGTYLGSLDEQTDHLYESALLQAAQSGINFFDTAINYRCQQSERIVGKVLRTLIEKGYPREQWVIATKGGYFPCEGNPDHFDETVRRQYLDPGIIEAKEIAAGCHCMSPAFLENQIDKSLANLQLEHIDLYYLHNPETQAAEMEEEEFYTRLTQAFSLLEKKVEEWKIGRYGLATWNGFRQKAGQKGTLQLERVLQCAREAGGASHHFKAVQLPYNLVMTEAAKQLNQICGQEKKSFLQVAQENQIAVMVSAPLMQAKVKQLARQVFEKLPPAETVFIQALEFVLSHPAICTAFCGMKKPEHLQENIRVLFK